MEQAEGGVKVRKTHVINTKVKENEVRYLILIRKEQPNIYSTVPTSMSDEIEISLSHSETWWRICAAVSD